MKKKISIIFNKKLKDYEKLSKKVDLLLNRIELKKKLKREIK